MKLSLSFSWVGLAVFALPMLINIAYALLPPAGKVTSGKADRRLEAVESVSRIAYFLAVTFLVSREEYAVTSVWLYFAAAFLVLYYIVWIRYFAGGRDVSLLGKPFLRIPMPLAVFPVSHGVST